MHFYLSRNWSLYKWEWSKCKFESLAAWFFTSRRKLSETIYNCASCFKGCGGNFWMWRVYMTHNLELMTSWTNFVYLQFGKFRWLYEYIYMIWLSCSCEIYGYNVAYIFMILFCSNFKKQEILTGMHDLSEKQIMSWLFNLKIDWKY